MKVTRKTLVPAGQMLEGRALLPAPLEQARLSDFELLLPACRAMTREELLMDPMKHEEAFCAALRRRISQGREYVWRENGQLVFRAAVAASTPTAALIEGVFTPGHERGKRRGTRAMAALCSRLLRIHDSVVLFVNSTNEPALRLYRRIGFEVFDEYQSVFFEPANPLR